MSNFYPRAKGALGRGEINVESVNFQVVLLDLDVYTYSDLHEFYSDLSGVVGTPSATLTNVTWSNDGLFDADNVNWPSLDGPEAEALAIFIQTGTPTTSRLWMYIDAATGLPADPNSGPVDIAWNASGIGQL